MCDPQTPYLTLQRMSLLSPGRLQVLGQRRERVAACPVVEVAGQSLGLPGVDQRQHVHGQVAPGSAACRLPPVLKLALQPAHPLAVLEPGVITHALGPDQPSSLLHKVMSVEKLEGEPGGQGSACGPLICACSSRSLRRSPVLTRDGDEDEKWHSEAGLRACLPHPGGGTVKTLLPSSHLIKTRSLEPERGPAPLTSSMAKRSLSKRAEEKLVLYPLTLGKTSDPKDRIHLFEVYIFCDLFVGKRKSPSCPKAMDAMRTVAETPLQTLPPMREATESYQGTVLRPRYSFSCKFFLILGGVRKQTVHTLRRDGCLDATIRNKL